jgi:regulator of ribosome biosynthesis
MADMDMQDAPPPASPSVQLQGEVEAAAADVLDSGRPKASISVSKPIPYTFDLGHLICYDTNPLPPAATKDDLTSTARDCAQSLLNQLLTTCPITSTPEGVHLSLPTPMTPLPREKLVPPPKEKTTWEKFAAKKGIAAKKRDGNKVFDEESGEWVPKWGYGGKNKKGEDSWLVEVDEKKEAGTGEADNMRTERRAERKLRVQRQERRERGNERRAVKGK